MKGKNAEEEMKRLGKRSTYKKMLIPIYLSVSLCVYLRYINHHVGYFLMPAFGTFLNHLIIQDYLQSEQDLVCVY